MKELLLFIKENHMPSRQDDIVQYVYLQKQIHYIKKRGITQEKKGIFICYFA